MERKILQRPLSILLIGGILLFGGTLESFGAEKPFRIELFYGPPYLTDAEKIQQAHQEHWLTFATLVHVFVVPNPEQFRQNMDSEMRAWDVKLTLPEDAESFLPLPRVKFFLHGQERKDKELVLEREFAPKRIEEMLSQLMGEYFDKAYQNDTKTDWVKEWLNPMKAFASESLVSRYVNLGKNRLRQVYPQGDASTLPLEDFPIEDHDQQLLQTAIDAFLEAIKETPDAANQNSLGFSYYLQRDYTKAEERFLQTVQQNPRSKTYQLNLAQTEVKLNKKQEALKILQRLNPNDSDVKPILLHLAQTDANQGKKQEALEILQPFPPTDPDVKPILLHLARTDANQDNKQGALEILQLLEPESREVKKLRNQLREGDTSAWVNAVALLGLAGGTVALSAFKVRGDADDAFEAAQSISPTQPIIAEEPTPRLTPEELDKQLDDWGKYYQLNRREKMLITPTFWNVIVDAAPFALDGSIKTRLPGKRWMVGGYFIKSLVWGGFALAENGNIDDAEKKLGGQEISDEDKLYYRGLRDEAKEKRTMYWVNAGIDFATVGLLLFFYDPRDGLPQQALQQANPSSLPIDLDYHFDGKTNHEMTIVFNLKSF